MRWKKSASALGAVLAPVVLLTVEALMVRGAPRIDPFSRDEVGGSIGEGSPAERVVWIGDSTGVGVGSSSADAALPRMVMRGLGRPVSLTVLADSGARVNDALTTQIPRVRELDPRWLFIAVGSNDVIHLTRRARFREYFDEMLSQVRDIEHVVVLGIGHFSSTPAFAQPLRWLVGARAKQLNGDVQAATERHGALFVDIITRVGEEFVDDPARYHARDRFHPSDLGYELWSRATLRAVREAGLVS